MEGIAFLVSTYSKERWFCQANDDGADRGRDDAHDRKTGNRWRATNTIRTCRDKCPLDADYRTETIRESPKVYTCVKSSTK